MKSDKETTALHVLTQEWMKRLRMQDWLINVIADEPGDCRLGRVIQSRRTGELWIEFDGPDEETYELAGDPDIEVEVVLGLLTCWVARLQALTEENKRNLRHGLYRLARCLVDYRRHMLEYWAGGQGDAKARLARAQGDFEEPLKRELLLGVWQQILRLVDWKLTLHWSPSCEMKEAGCDGWIGICRELMDAEIHVERTDCQKPEERERYDPEAVLVHELLHIHLDCLGIPSGDPRQTLEEQMIEGLTSAFIGIRRGMG